MSNLNSEFNKLVQEMYQKIEAKRVSGELLNYEADELCNRVADSFHLPEEEPDRGWNDSGCSMGSDSDDDSGWSPSTC